MTQVTQEYLDGIKEGRDYLKKFGMENAHEVLANLNDTIKLFPASSLVGQSLRGERDFWKLKIKSKDSVRIPLRNVADIVARLPRVSKYAEAARAIDFQISRGLAFDPGTGTVYQGARWVSRYSNPSDYDSSYGTIEEVAADHMSSAVANSASRLQRGLTA